jgi:hypothetical protein
MPHALYGDGPSKVIALHGWLGDRHAFDALVPSLDQRAFTFEIPDIRGYGNLKQQPAKQIGPATPAGCPTVQPVLRVLDMWVFEVSRARVVSARSVGDAL